MAETNNIVGASVERKEGMAKVLGRALYVDDISLPGMWYGATVRSSIARGRILSIDFPPGINWNEFVIVTAKDIPGENCIIHLTKDQPCLANGFVNHPDEPILLLAHPDRAALHAAVAAVQIEYEPWPGVFTIEESEKMAPVIWDQGEAAKHLQELPDGEGRSRLGLGKRRLHRRGRVSHRRAGAALHREQWRDRRVLRRRRA